MFWIYVLYTDKYLLKTFYLLLVFLLNSVLKNDSFNFDEVRFLHVFSVFYGFCALVKKFLPLQGHSSVPSGFLLKFDI